MCAVCRRKTKNIDAKQLANDVIKPKQFYTLTYSQFEEIVCSYYKRKHNSYSFVESWEASNDAHYVFEAKKETLGEWDNNTLQEFRKSKDGICSPYILIIDLVNNDIIPEGDYLIGVSW